MGSTTPPRSRAIDPLAKRRAAARLAGCIARLLLVWSALACVPAVCVAGGVHHALGTSFYIATLISGAPVPTDPPRTPRASRPPRHARSSARPIRGLCGFALGTFGGLATHPALTGLILLMGHAIGLEALSPASSLSYDSEPAHASIRLLLALIVLAPLFEEILYRGVLLPRCLACSGPWRAVLISSLAFALPHGRPWAIFGALIAGSILGAIRLRSRNVLPCIAIHAGWNVSACLAPSVDRHDPTLVVWGALLGGLGIAGALWLQRPRRGPSGAASSA